MLISRPIEVAHWLVDHRQADQPPDTVSTLLSIPTLDRLLTQSTSFETQLPGAILAIAFLAYLAAEGHGLTNTFFEVIHSKFYVISLLGRRSITRRTGQMTDQSCLEL